MNITISHFGGIRHKKHTNESLAHLFTIILSISVTYSIPSITSTLRYFVIQLTTTFIVPRILRLVYSSAVDEGVLAKVRLKNLVKFLS